MSTVSLVFIDNIVSDAVSNCSEAAAVPPTGDGPVTARKSLTNC